MPHNGHTGLPTYRSNPRWLQHTRAHTNSKNLRAQYLLAYLQCCVKVI